MLACQEDIVTGYFTTERHDRLRRTVREFAETKVRPLIPEMEASRSVQHTLSRLIARQGWIGVTTGHQYGDLRDAFHIFAPAGTSDIQLLRLGEAAIGTAKGQWSERFAEASAAAAEAIRADGEVLAELSAL